MFDSLTERLSQTFRNMVGKGKLSDENMKKPLKEVREALIEADVALPVVKSFVKNVAEVARGVEITKELAPAQAVVKMVSDELTKVMGEQCEELNLKAQAPVVVLMAGLQGSGKTTTVAKLAKWLTERQKKKVMVVSTDVYRPAAIEQLQTLATEVDTPFFLSDQTEKPVDIAKKALAAAKSQLMDVLIVDTAGRLHIDEAMMTEIQQLNAAINPTETLFVVDGMMGQDAAKTAKVFKDCVPLTGVVVTKLDGDARGGAILSVRQVTDGCPIKFIGVGEKIDALEPFYPERMASRILGMGDVVSLVEELEHKIDKEKADKLAKKISKGRSINLNDLKDQLLEVQKMGGMKSMMDKLPGMGRLADAASSRVGDQVTVQMLALINSMTPLERKKPNLIKGSRKRRIALGSGNKIQDVNKLLKQLTQMQKMIKKVSNKGSMMKMMKKFEGMLPPGQ